MLKAAIIGVAVAAGVHPLAVAVTAAAMWQPWLVIAALPAWVALERRKRRRQRPGPDDEAALLRSLAAELSAGASLRAALVVASGSAPRLGLSRAARLAAAGMPAEAVAESLGAALPVNGRLASAAWLLAARSGGPAATVAQSLAGRAAEEGALRRERRSLTAQARASAWVVVGMPVLLLVAMAVTGRLGLDDPALLPIVIAGLTLQAAGVAVVVWMLRRAEA